MGKGKGSKRSGSHQEFKNKARNRVDDLHEMFAGLQTARRESRSGDAAVLEEQVHQMLREWKAELNESSPASSLLGGSVASSDLPSDIQRLLQLCDEEDDATSVLVGPQLQPQPSQVVLASPIGNPNASLNCYEKHAQNECGFQGSVDHCKATPSIGPQNMILNNSNLEASAHLDYHHHQFNLDHEFQQELFLDFDSSVQQHQQQQGDDIPHLSDLLSMISPPPCAFLGPKCALWDCPRPALGTDWYSDYCISFHATMAMNEGAPGMLPVLRPGGIDLKDGPLFAALSAKMQGKDVGIPECEGAATTKSPWNAPELFDLLVLEGELIREWLFFDKSRRAFESGNRKQRSLPDYVGRGWHESRKQVMKEFGGLKRSYYMDPQPMNNFEWHLYEYEIDNCDACALYRLELKLVDTKKSAKGRVTNDSLVDLQQQMVRLSAEYQADGKRSVKGRMKANPKNRAMNGYPNFDQAASGNENFDYGLNMPYDYPDEYYGMSVKGPG
ncbi:Transcription factor VOZ1 [Acorus gramineus]|uniref:Transcription factor VOZ1 n=1 Tax=Acorus gramineus TaxID=55184 RepID=A0AAV9AYE1_ACOGR|nr:Transcription factor VOZ1 [Acorus gramineus]